MPIARSFMGRNTVTGAAPVQSSITATLKQFWRQNAGQGNPPTLITGPNPMTVTSGSLLVAFWSGADSIQITVPGDNNGTFTNRLNGEGNGSDHIWAGFATINNATGGSHTITPQVIVNGGGGEVLLWIYEFSAMPTTYTTRDSGTNANPSSSAQSWTVTSGGSAAVAGDLVLIGTTYENSIPLAGAQLTDPPSGYMSLGISQDASGNIPTSFAYKIASAGSQTASWSCVDANKTEHVALLLVIAAS